MSVPMTGRVTRMLAAAAFAAVALGTALPSSSAIAHDALVSASPAENESLAVAPEAVELEFTDDLLDTGALIRVTNTAGEQVTEGALELKGRTVTQALIADLPNGQYTIVWRVVSADGHPITDTYRFAVGEPVETEDSHAQSDEDVATNDGNASPSNDVPVTTSSADSPDWGRIATLAGIGALTGIALYGSLIALRKRSSEKDSKEEK